MMARAARSRGVLPLVVGLPLLLLGAVTWMRADGGLGGGVLLFTLGFVCVTGGLLCVAAPAELTIGPDGLLLKGALHTKRYGWDQVSNFRLIQMRRTRLIGFDRPGARRMMTDVASALSASPDSGTYDAALPGSWDRPADEVVTALNEARARWGGAAAASAPPPRPRHATGQRIDRRVYWIAAGVLLAFGVVLATLTHGTRYVSGGLTVLWIWVIARRLHDIGRSGWWQAAVYAAEMVLAVVLVDLHAGLAAVTGVLSMVHLAFVAGLGAIPGTAGDNRFGPPPGRLEPQVQAEVFS